MGYDIYLYRRDKVKRALDLNEAQKKLMAVFPRVKMCPKGDRAEGWEILDGNFSDGEEYFYQGDKVGCYHVRCAYGVSDKVYADFVDRLVKVARCLDLLIEDPQLQVFDKKLLTADEYAEFGDEGSRAVEYKKDLLTETPFLIPAEKKYFTLYMIGGVNPAGTGVNLVALDDRLFAGKVEKGQSLKEVLIQDVIELTGSNVFKLLSVDWNHDYAYDRKGNKLKRVAVRLNVPYFDPKKVETLYPVKWQ